MAEQPRRMASSTDEVSAEQGAGGSPRPSLLFTLRISGSTPAYSAATASMKPSGAA
jgi:hypothetical protein